MRTIGAGSGVLGVIAGFTFAVGVSDAAAHPARFGQDYQFVAVFGSDGHDFRPNGPVLAALATDPAVAGLTDIRTAAAGSGATPVLAHSYKPVGARCAKNRCWSVGARRSTRGRHPQ